jgi:hypothetical protein
MEIKDAYLTSSCGNHITQRGVELRGLTINPKVRVFPPRLWIRPHLLISIAEAIDFLILGEVFWRGASGMRSFGFVWWRMKASVNRARNPGNGNPSTWFSVRMWHRKEAAFGGSTFVIFDQGFLITGSSSVDRTVKIARAHFAGRQRAAGFHY